MVGAVILSRADAGYIVEDGRRLYCRGRTPVIFSRTGAVILSRADAVRPYGKTV